MPHVPLRVVLREWGRIGCLGFGGPPAHIALLRELVVDRRGWLDEDEVEDAIAACNLLPGPASTQLAIFTAWRVRGRMGALVGGLAFILPGLVTMVALSMLFLATAPPEWVRGAGAGAGAAVAAVAVQAAWTLIPGSWRRAAAEHPPGAAADHFTRITADRVAAVTADPPAAVTPDRAAGLTADRAAGVTADPSAGITGDHLAGLTAVHHADRPARVTSDRPAGGALRAARVRWVVYALAGAAAAATAGPWVVLVLLGAGALEVARRRSASTRGRCSPPPPRRSPRSRGSRSRSARCPTAAAS